MRKHITIVISLILIIISLALYFLWRGIKESGFESCALSIEGAFGMALDSNEFNRKIKVTNEWRTLDEHEERMLFDKFISMGRTFDCYQFPEYSDGSVLKGDHGRIKAKRDGKRILVRFEIDGGYTRREL
jgi:hypothetical protein